MIPNNLWNRLVPSVKIKLIERFNGLPASYEYCKSNMERCTSWLDLRYDTVMILAETVYPADYSPAYIGTCFDTVITLAEPE
jgi:hypothetical protein